MTTALRLVRPDDLEQIRRWRMQPEITRYMYTDPVLTIEDQRLWLDRIEASDRDIAWVITMADGKPVGLLSLGGIDRSHRRCHWAYYIADPAGRGIGLAKALECNVCDLVFETLCLDKLECEVLASNDRVVRLHEAFGSRIEGVRRAHIRKGDAVHDVVLMGILREEWLERRATLRYATIPIELPGMIRP